MDVLMECCCGLDVHRDIVEACIIKGLLDTPDKIQEQFKTTRQELLRMVNWLTENECYYIAMESTGVSAGIRKTVNPPYEIFIGRILIS